MTLSIIVPVFNGMPFLPATIRSLERLADEAEVEVIFQDAESRDGTSELLADACRRRPDWRHFREADKGQSDAINRGVTRCTRPWVTWLCADDLLLPDFRHLLGLLEYPDLDVVYGDVVLLVDGKIGPAVGTEAFEPGKLSACRLFIQQPGTCIRRDVWNRAGGLDQSLYWVMDYDLFMRMEAGGARFFRVERFVAVARIHPDAKSSSGSLGRLKEYRKILRRAHKDGLLAKSYQPYLLYFLEYLIRNAEARDSRFARACLPIMHKVFWRLADPREEQAITSRFHEMQGRLEEAIKECQS
jgi:glycosyltransferase involved in cell wall biosynthesis